MKKKNKFYRSPVYSPPIPPSKPPPRGPSLIQPQQLQAQSSKLQPVGTRLGPPPVLAARTTGSRDSYGKKTDEKKEKKSLQSRFAKTMKRSKNSDKKSTNGSGSTILDPGEDIFFVCL